MRDYGRFCGLSLVASNIKHAWYYDWIFDNQQTVLFRDTTSPIDNWRRRLVVYGALIVSRRWRGTRIDRYLRIGSDWIFRTWANGMNRSQGQAQHQGRRCRQSRPQGTGCTKTLTQRNEISILNEGKTGQEVAQDPYLDHIPPPQDSATLPIPQIPSQVRPPRDPPRPPQGHCAPSQHRERHEEDRGEQHTCLHCGRQGQQASDQGCS